VCVYVCVCMWPCQLPWVLVRDGECVCVCTYVCVYVCFGKYVYIRSYLHSHTHTHTYTYIHTLLHTYIYRINDLKEVASGFKVSAGDEKDADLGPLISPEVCVCVYVCMCVCVCIYV